MQELIIILLSVVSILDVWINTLVFPICYEKRIKDLNRIQRAFRWVVNRKPFNCDVCMSFWIGLILSILYLNIGFLLLPLLTKIKNRLI